jgi:acetyltransferase EpsM
VSRRALVLVGGGEHARVVAEAARSQPAQFELRGFVDPALCKETVQRLALPRLGDEDALSEHRDAYALIAFGAVEDAGRRAQAADRLAGVTQGFAVVVHAHAWVSPTAEIAEGAVVMAGAVVQGGARIGAHCIVNSGAVIEHDVMLEAFVHVAPRAAIGGGARIGLGSFIGLGACVRDHVTVGARCVVGMGSVVVGDLPDGARVKGVPAR